MSDDYDLVRMSEDRHGDFSLLAEDAFGVKPTLEDNKNLFDTSAWGTSYVAYLACTRDSGDASAFYGIFPCYVEYHGKKYLAAQSGSTMTHTKHRKKGLFYRTAKKTFELAREEGIGFIFGFPNPTSYPGFMKMGWSHDGNIRSYKILIPTFPLGYLASKVKFLEPLYRRWFGFVAGHWKTEYRAFPNSARGEGVGTVCHDEALLAYKPENDSRFMLRIGKSLVWINQRSGRVGIGDIELTDDIGDLNKVLRTLKLIGFLTGSFQLSTYVSPGCRLDQFFREIGYRGRQGIAIIHLDLDSHLPLDRFKYVYADFDTF